MSMRDATRDLDAHLALLRLEKLQHVLQVSAVHVLHHDEVRAGALPDVEHLNALRMAEIAHEPRLIEEHVDELSIRQKASAVRA